MQVYDRVGFFFGRCTEFEVFRFLVGLASFYWD
jgi:hypothetical protein